MQSVYGLLTIVGEWIAEPFAQYEIKDTNFTFRCIWIFDKFHFIYSFQPYLRKLLFQF